jgi:hypothetical protein
MIEEEIMLLLEGLDPIKKVNVINDLLTLLAVEGLAPDLLVKVGR